MLRSLLTYAHDDDSVAKLVEAAHAEPQRAFVSSSLRPYLLASLIDADPERPALIVAGDDRSARDLAADLKQFLALYCNGNNDVVVRTERRATSVREYLTSRGVGADRLRTVSYGEERPKYDNAREETRRLNRRAALVVRLTQ